MKLALLLLTTLVALTVGESITAADVQKVVDANEDDSRTFSFQAEKDKISFKSESKRKTEQLKQAAKLLVEIRAEKNSQLRFRFRYEALSKTTGTGGSNTTAVRIAFRHRYAAVAEWLDANNDKKIDNGEIKQVWRVGRSAPFGDFDYSGNADVKAPNTTTISDGLFTARFDFHRRAFTMGAGAAAVELPPTFFKLSIWLNVSKFPNAVDANSKLLLLTKIDKRNGWAVKNKTAGGSVEFSAFGDRSEGAGGVIRWFSEYEVTKGDNSVVKKNALVWGATADDGKLGDVSDGDNETPDNGEDTVRQIVVFEQDGSGVAKMIFYDPGEGVVVYADNTARAMGSMVLCFFALVALLF